MKQVALDTNVLIDYFTERGSADEHEVVFRDILEGRIELYLPIAVLLECEWVLRSVYHLTKQSIIKHLRLIVELLPPHYPDRELLLDALTAYARHANISFVDSVVVFDINRQRVERFVTGDRALRRFYDTLHGAT